MSYQDRYHDLRQSHLHHPLPERFLASLHPLPALHPQEDSDIAGGPRSPIPVREVSLCLLLLTREEVCEVYEPSCPLNTLSFPAESEVPASAWFWNQYPAQCLLTLKRGRSRTVRVVVSLLSSLRIELEPVSLTPAIPGSGNSMK